MLVRFVDDAAFGCGSPQVYSQLRRLFEQAALGRHAIDVSDPGTVISSDFFQRSVAANAREEWIEIVRRSGPDHFRGPSKFVAVDSPGSGAESPISVVPRALLGDWAERPLRIVLENARDAVLVRLAERLAGLDALAEAIRHDWLVCDGRGGTGEVLRTIRDSPQGTRILVIVDSDRDAPGASPSQMIQLVEEECVRRGFPVHVLKRREVENYVPESIWDIVVPRAVAGRSQATVADRTRRVYERLVDMLDQEVDRLRKWHSHEAVQEARARLVSLAKPLPARIAWTQLEAWRALAAADRWVDDLKVRLGSRARAGVDRLSDGSFDASELDPDAQSELREIAQLLMTWL